MNVRLNKMYYYRIKLNNIIRHREVVFYILLHPLATRLSRGFAFSTKVGLVVYFYFIKVYSLNYILPALSYMCLKSVYDLILEPDIRISIPQWPMAIFKYSTSTMGFNYFEIVDKLHSHLLSYTYKRISNKICVQ